MQWFVSAPRTIWLKGRAFVDVLIENVGEVDVKKIKIDIKCPQGIEYDGGAVMIDLMMAHESRKVSFTLRHVDEQQSGPFEVTLAIGYEFMTKFVRRNADKKISLSIKRLQVGLVRSDDNGNISSSEINAFGAIKTWLQEKGVGLKVIDLSSVEAILAQAPSSSSFLEERVDVLIVSAHMLARSKELADFMTRLASSGVNVFVYSAGQDGDDNGYGPCDGDRCVSIRNEKYKGIAKLTEAWA